jgi:hypothetical protein
MKIKIEVSQSRQAWNKNGKHEMKIKTVETGVEQKYEK